MLDSVATLVGPLLAAVLVEFTDVAVVFAVAAAALLVAAALLLRLRYDAPPRHDVSTSARVNRLMSKTGQDTNTEGRLLGTTWTRFRSCLTCRLPIRRVDLDLSVITQLSWEDHLAFDLGLLVAADFRRACGRHGPEVVAMLDHVQPG
jgi:hypothetical protein